MHIPSLDGLRGVAAMLVFVAHAGLQDTLPGGFGVTVFFFLSGYLITTLLRREYEQKRTLSFRKFYLRRLYRIFPPMYLVLLTLIALALLGVIRNDMSVGGVAAQFLQYTNYYLIFSPSEEAARIVPYTAPYWSLAVEEHFYLLFPLALLFLLRRLDYRRTAAILLGVCTLILLWRCFLVMHWSLGNQYTYYATDTRLDSLLYGCIMGVWCNPALDREEKLPRGAWMALLLGGSALLLFTFVYRAPAFRETFRYTLQGIALFPIFFCAVRFPRWPLFSWLGWRVMRGLGLISYTFYLCHLAALRITHQYVDGNPLVKAVVGLAAAIAFASASYWFMERHLAALRKRLHEERAPPSAATLKQSERPI
jgi:peptidoglycan/LPS O-acetylase OafA/YrhL